MAPKRQTRGVRNHSGEGKKGGEKRKGEREKEKERVRVASRVVAVMTIALIVGIVTTNFFGNLNNNDDSDDDSNSNDSGGVNKDDNDDVNDNDNNVYRQRRLHRTKRRIYERKRDTGDSGRPRDLNATRKSRPSLAAARTIVIRPLGGRCAQTRSKDQ